MDFKKRASDLDKIAAIASGQAYGLTASGKKVLREQGYVIDKDLSTPEALVLAPAPGTRTDGRAPPVIVAFRGTVPSSPADVATDVALAAGKLRQTPRFKRSLGVARAAAKKYGQTPGGYVSTGHSLGGALALWVARETGWTAKSFNPGVGADLLPRLKRSAADKKRGRRSTIWRHPGDLVSILGRAGESRLLRWIPAWAPSTGVQFWTDLAEDLREGRKTRADLETLNEPLLAPLSAHGIELFTPAGRRPARR